MIISIFGLDIRVDDPSVILETFNLVTITSATVTGFMFGWLAFVPLVRAMVPDNSPPPPTAKTAFWLTFGIIVIVFGSLLTVFYAEQMLTEAVTREMVSMRAVGRYLTFVTFLLAFAAGVGLTVYREFRTKRAADTLDVHSNKEV